MSGGTASPWQRRPDAAALVAWPAGAIAHVSQVLQVAWQDWARDWDVGGVCEQPVSCGEAVAAPAADDAWQGLGQAARGAAWICAAPDEDLQLAQALFGTADAATPVVRELVACCRAEARGRLASALKLVACDGGCAPPPASAWRPWNGALLATLPLGVRVLLDAALVRTLVPATVGAAKPAGALPPLVSVPKAAGALTIPLQVRLLDCQVDLGTLQDLQAGDVVRLPHSLDAPAAVVGREGPPLFGGYLGRRRGRKAIELAPTATASMEEETP